MLRVLFSYEVSLVWAQNPAVSDNYPVKIVKPV